MECRFAPCSLPCLQPIILWRYHTAWYIDIARRFAGNIYLDLTGTMQMLDIRHYELFLYDGWNNGTWKYEEVASHEIPFHCGQASGMVLCSDSLQSTEVQGEPQCTRLHSVMVLAWKDLQVIILGWPSSHLAQEVDGAWRRLATKVFPVLLGSCMHSSEAFTTCCLYCIHQMGYICLLCIIWQASYDIVCRGIATQHAAAASTNLQPNEGGLAATVIMLENKTALSLRDFNAESLIFRSEGDLWEAFWRWQWSGRRENIPAIAVKPCARLTSLHHEDKIIAHCLNRLHESDASL